MLVSISTRKVRDRDGSLKLIAVRKYHCRDCHTFVYTENAGPADLDPAGAKV